MSGGFSFFEHTADAGLNVRGSTLKEIFEYSALGMCSLIFNPEKISDLTRVKIEAYGENTEDLLFQWLKEILYRINTTGILFSSFRIKKNIFSGSKSDKYYICADAYGELLDVERHDVCMEIKAVTRHLFKLERGKQDWKATIIFDI